jgi:hypothetical protein
MSFIMQGLGPSDQQAVVTLSAQVIPALREVSRIVAKGGALAESDMWFGDSSRPWMQRLSTNLNRMANVVNMEPIHVSFRSLAHRKGSFAAAQRPAGGWGNYMSVSSARGQGFILKLDTRWNTSPLHRSRTELDSQFQTFVHEITHMLMDTDDIEYGQKSCRLLAKQSPYRAKNNADNWGYFVEECIYKSRNPRVSTDDDFSLGNLFG